MRRFLALLAFLSFGAVLDAAEPASKTARVITSYDLVQVRARLALVPQDRHIRLTLVPEQEPTGMLRQWFRAEYVPAPTQNCPAPTFVAIPSETWMEPWPQNPYYGWIAYVPGDYVIVAYSNAPGCESAGALTIHLGQGTK